MTFFVRVDIKIAGALILAVLLLWSLCLLGVYFPDSHPGSRCQKLIKKYSTTNQLQLQLNMSFQIKNYECS